MTESIVFSTVHHLETELMRQMRTSDSLSFKAQQYTIQRFRRVLASSCLLILVLASMGWAQQPPAKSERNKTAAPQPNPMEDLNKYPGLLEEYGRLMSRFQREVKLPPARTQSQLLHLMPQATIAYGTFPNYGTAAHQVLDIFHEELKTSTPLRDWWQHNQANSKGPNLETMLKRYYELSEYLGDEVVASGMIRENGGGFILVGEVKKPGLEEFLRTAVKELAGKSTPAQVLNLRELASAKATDDQPVILVRPELVIFSSDLKTLRSFNAKLGIGQPTLDTTAFGKRLSESYQKGVEILLAADLQTIQSQLRKGHADDQLIFQRTGFADAKYAIWEYSEVSGLAPNRAELSFLGPRRGIASWLAAPARLSGLDFVSPDAAVVLSVLLKNPADIFADMKSFTDSPQNAQQLANLEPTVLPVLSQLTGEITMELDALPPASAEWKMILGTKDMNALRQALSPFLAQLRPVETVKDGETYYLLQIPNANKPTDIAFSFQPGHLVIGSSLQAVTKAVLAHRSGASLSKSERYRSALPAGHNAEASAIMYQNSAGFMSAILTQLPPEVRKNLLQSPSKDVSTMSALYGEETAIREASSGGAAGVAPVLIVAAIAIPNLLRSRIAANESSAVGSVRSINTAQVIYAATYPEHGFARDLATLGSSSAQKAPSATRALLLDSSLGCSGGTAGNWCIKSGYKFTIHTNCAQQRCNQYAAIATPVSTSTGQRSFCSTADGVIRWKTVPPLTSVITATECKSWAPIH